MTDNLGTTRMAGPDKEDPVSTDVMVDTRDIPVKASPPREKSPAATDTDTNTSHGDTGALSAPPPDGGWGWFVVLASFMIHIIGEGLPGQRSDITHTFVSADGITYSFGVFLVALIKELDADRGATSLIPSILVGVTLGSGKINHKHRRVVSRLMMTPQIFRSDRKLLYKSIWLQAGHHWRGNPGCHWHGAVSSRELHHHPLLHRRRPHRPRLRPHLPPGHRQCLNLL